MNIYTLVYPSAPYSHVLALCMLFLFSSAAGLSDPQPWYAYSFGDRDILMRTPSSPLAGKGRKVEVAACDFGSNTHVACIENLHRSWMIHGLLIHNSFALFRKGSDNKTHVKFMAFCSI